jgi:hypothetical protein
MIKRLLFPVAALLILAASVALTPQTAHAVLCNDKVCHQIPGGPEVCHTAVQGPHAWCVDVVPGDCLWGWCFVAE